MVSDDQDRNAKNTERATKPWEEKNRPGKECRKLKQQKGWVGDFFPETRSSGSPMKAGKWGLEDRRNSGQKECGQKVLEDGGRKLCNF